MNWTHKKKIYRAACLKWNGENGEFKMMRPDEFELKYEVI